MRTLRSRWCLAFVWAATTLAWSHAGEPSVPRSLAALEETLGNFPNEADRVLAATKEAIHSGTVEEGWTDPAKQKAMDWLALHAPLGDLVQGRNVPLDSLLQKPEPPPFPKESLAEREWNHYLALWKLRRSVVLAAAVQTNELVEKVWLEARKPEDLQPACAALDALRQVSGELWRFDALERAYQHDLPAIPIARSPAEFLQPQPELLLPIEEAASAEMLLRPDSFIIPNADEDPAGWANAWVASRQLDAWKLAFLQRPAIAAKLVDLAVAYRSRVLSLFDKVEQGLLNDSPYEQYESSLQELAKLSPLNFEPVRQESFIRPLPPNFDYASLLMLPLPLSNDAQLSKVQWIREMEEIARKIHGIETLAQWRHYRLSGDLKNEAIAYEEMRPDELNGCQRLLDAWDLWIYEPEADNSADATLAARLAKLRSVLDNKEVPPAAERLLAAWQEVSNGTESQVGRFADCTDGWQTLATRPRSLELFHSRDREAEAALAKIVGTAPATSSGKNLGELFASALEKSILAGDLKMTGRILALDDVVCALPGHLRASYQMCWRDLTAAATQADTAPEVYRHILSETTNPACARLAARLLKESSAHAKPGISRRNSPAP